MSMTHCNICGEPWQGHTAACKPKPQGSFAAPTGSADVWWEVRWKIGRHQKRERFLWSPMHSKAYDRAYIISGTGNNELRRVKGPSPQNDPHEPRRE